MFWGETPLSHALKRLLSKMNLAKDKQSSKFSIELELAEEAHLKNCPNAEFSLRLASTIVDLILTYLATAGFQNINKALTLFFSHAIDYAPTQSSLHDLALVVSANSVEISFIIEVCLKVFFVYFYYVVSTCFSGGTPGKLLLGLRVLNYETGKKLLPGIAFLRFGISLLSLGVSYLMIPFNKDYRAYHDVLTHSCVKKVHGAR